MYVTLKEMFSKVLQEESPGCLTPSPTFGLVSLLNCTLVCGSTFTVACLFFLMTGDAEPLLMCSLANHTCSENQLLELFVFLLLLFVFLLLICGSSLCFLDTSSWSDMWLINIFSGLSFHFGIFDEHRF